MKTTRQIYCQFLLNSQRNYTCTYLADHYAGLDHNSIHRYLKTAELTPHLLREHIADDLVMSPNGYLIFDDTVLDKSHSSQIEGVRRQYSGNAHGIVKGIGLVGCVYLNPELGRYWPIDFRLFDPERDGKTKLDHVADMLEGAAARGVVFRTVLMDSWYATRHLMMMIEDMGKIFYCPLKSNRLVDDSGGSQKYRPVSELDWPPDALKSGKRIKIRGFPADYKVQLFRVAVSTHRTEWLVTNDLTQDDTKDAQEVSAQRWKIEQLHRELKQLTGIEKCQCRINRSQRNHICSAFLVWQALNRVAHQVGKTLYQVKEGLLDDYMTQMLRKPRIQYAF
jgi:hypothetical protein